MRTQLTMGHRADAPCSQRVTSIQSGRGRRALCSSVSLALSLALVATTLSVAGASSAPPSLATVVAVAAPYRGAPPATSPSAVAMAAVPDGSGYYVLRANGEVDAYGVAYYGSLATASLAPGETATGIAYDAATGGYWIVTSGGRVHGFNAPYLGQPHIVPGGWGQHAAAVGIAAAPDGSGYYVVRANGGVNGFGVPWHGSLAGHLRYGATAPVVAVGIAIDASTGGYWIALSDGRVASFDAPFDGEPLDTDHPAYGAMAVTAIAPALDGGYYVLRANGTVERFTSPTSGASKSSVHLPEGALASGVAVDAATGGYYVALDYTPVGGYLNPLRGVSALVPQEIDQGVDYCGSGPVYAMGNAVVENVYAGDWPSGVFIAYRLSDGPAKGLVVYVAENLTPKVVMGQRVTPRTVLGVVHDARTCMETGWADGSAPNGHVAGHFEYNGRNSTAFGLNFSALLALLGARPGLVQHGDAPGPLPAWWPSW